MSGLTVRSLLPGHPSSESSHGPRPGPTLTCFRLASLVILLLCPNMQVVLLAQRAPDSITVVLAPEFEREWPYGMLFGDHHQALWTAPVTIELLDLASHAGGLKPCREIVTPDNRLLLLAAASGDTMFFTPLRERFADEHVDPRDRRLVPVHPTSALVADELGGAAGLLRSKARLAWMPDDSLLGDFRSTYGGCAGYLTGSGPEDLNAPVPFLDSRELFGVLDADSRNRVDTKAFLLSRCVDLLTGDWERSLWKWWWIQTSKDGGAWYIPMPALRRRSLIMLSSFPEMIHSALTPGFLNFTGDLSDVSRAVTTGAAADVRILAEMDRPTWEGIAREFKTAMSDSVIDAAVQKLPGAHREAEGDTLAWLLKTRRDSFESISSRYYLTLAEYTEVRLSDAPEHVTIERSEDGRVSLTAWQRGPAPVHVYTRAFLPEETAEIRLHCLGGNDTVIVRGKAERSIVVRVNGGPGDDAITDESTVRDSDSGFLGWFSTGTDVTFIYDHEGENRLLGGTGTSIDTSPESEFVPPGRFY